MSNIEKGSFTPASTGDTVLALVGSFTPNFFTFWMDCRPATTETLVTRSDGVCDFTNSRHYSCSRFDDGTIRRTIDSTTEDIIHYEDHTGTFTLICAGHVTATAAGQFTFHVDTATSNYKIHFIAQAL